MTKPERRLTTIEAAEYLSCSTRTLEHWRKTDKGPRYLKIGTFKVLYRQSDLDEFLCVVETADTRPDSRTAGR